MVPVSLVCRIGSLYPIVWFTDVRMENLKRSGSQDQQHEKLTSSFSQAPLTGSAAQLLEDATCASAKVEAITNFDEKTEINEDLLKVFQDVLQRKDHAFENRDKMTLMLLQYNRDHMVGDEQQTGRRLLKQFLASRFLWIDIEKNKKISSGSLIKSDDECQQIVDICLARYSKFCHSVAANAVGRHKALKCVWQEFTISRSKLAISLLESIMDTCLSIPKLKPHFLPLAESRCVHDVSHFSDYLLGINLLPQEFEDDPRSPEEFYGCHNSALIMYMTSLLPALQLLSKTILWILTRYGKFTTERGLICDQLSVHRFRRLFELMSFHDTTSDDVESDVLDLLVEFTGLDRMSCRQNPLYWAYLAGLYRMRNTKGLASMPFLTVVHGEGRHWKILNLDEEDLVCKLTRTELQFHYWNSSISNLCQDLLTEFGLASWVSAAEQELPETLNILLNLVTYTNEFRLATLILLTSCAVNVLKTMVDIGCQARDVVGGVLLKYLNDLWVFTILKSALSLDRLFLDFDKFTCRKHTGVDWILKFKEFFVFYQRQVKKMSLIVDIVEGFYDFSLKYENAITNGDAIMFDQEDNNLFSLLSELSVLY